jgi:hypothetical protein
VVCGVRRHRRASALPRDLRLAAVEWVNGARYLEQRSGVLAERDTERRLRGLLRRVASVTPRGGELERGWRALEAQAQRCFKPARTALRFTGPPRAGEFGCFASESPNARAHRWEETHFDTEGAMPSDCPPAPGSRDSPLFAVAWPRSLRRRGVRSAACTSAHQLRLARAPPPPAG